MCEKKEYRKTPLMGWASWNAFRTNITEETLKEQARALVESGLAAKGYTYFNIDDGFFGGRSESGKVQAHEKRFPNGMKTIADHAHALGLKAGIYAEAGDNTCGYYYDQEGKNGEGVGLYGYEEQDLRLYLQIWGYDFIKVDFCGGIRMCLDEEEQYTKIGKIIEKIREEEQRPIVYNVCRWQFPGAWVTKIADSWRTGADINPNFDSVVYQLDMIKPLRKYCSSGHVNDLDMLQVGNGMTREEDEAHFAMWCMMSTPLMLGCDLTKVSSDLIELVGNEELIAIDQDVACQQAFVTKEIYVAGKLAAEVWVKNLETDHSPKKAIAFLNRSTESVEIEASLKELGLNGKAEDIFVRDLIQHQDIRLEEEEIRLVLKPHSCKVYRMEAPAAVSVREIVEELPEYQENRFKLEEALAYCRENPDAVLVDVREQDEYEYKHPEHALSLPYSEMHANAKKVLPDQKQKIILYCNTGKKSSQAAKNLFYLGYINVSYTALYLK